MSGRTARNVPGPLITALGVMLLSTVALASSPGVSTRTDTYTPAGIAPVAKMPMVTCDPAATTTSVEVAAVCAAASIVFWAIR